MGYVLALDQGTTSSRAILFDEQGHARHDAQREFEQIYPRAGWIEHDPEEIWRTQRDVAREVLEQAGADAGEVAALGISNQRETTVLWDRSTGEPVHNAIVWQDRRTSGICDELNDAGHAGLVRSKTGLVIDAYFSGTKLKWLLDHVDGARERAERGELAFGTIDSWLIWKLTGGRVHATDVTNASRTMLLDIHRLEWDDELLELLEVPRALLPEVRASSGVLTDTDPEVFGRSLPIAGIAGDQQAALFGQVCFSPEKAKTTYGTGCFLLTNVGEQPRPSEHGLLSTVAWQIDGRTEYALEGSVFVGGAVVQWLRDGLGLIGDSSEIEALARTVEDNGGVYLVPAFAGLGAPYWDQYARGTIAGITRGTTAGHFARAALESIAYQVRDVLEVMQRDAGEPLAEMRADGGAAVDDLLMQFQADILRAPVIRPKVTETTALGAAYLAGLAVGLWSGRDDVAGHWEAERVFEPEMSERRVEHRLRRWAEALSRARDWEERSTIDVRKMGGPTANGG
jgi:glycerol kinase